MYRKILIYIILIAGSISTLHSQVGNSVYSFLDLPVSSRIASLGGSNVSLRDNDLSFSFCNPALLSSENNKQISLSIANYLAGIKFGTAMYGFQLKEKHLLAVGMQYIDYGKFVETSETNEELGSFTAKDMALYLIYNYKISDRISVGGTLKPVYSVYERYTSYGVAMDAGASYAIPEKFFYAGITLRNIGTQLKGYYNTGGNQHYEPLPFQIEAGISKKLNHAPFRFSLTLHNLQRWNLNYLSGENVDDELTKEASFLDMALRHTIIGVEFVPGKNFYLSAAYNHRRQSELKMTGFKSAAGFSFGGGIKLYKFHVGFGMTTFQTGLSAYQFSIATALNDFGL